MKNVENILIIKSNFDAFIIQLNIFFVKNIRKIIYE